MFKLIVCVSILIAIVGADYNFQDSTFNELLVKDLLGDIDDDLIEIQRLKRDDENNDGNNQTDNKSKKSKGSEWQSHCCSGKKGDPEFLNSIREVKKTCIAEVSGGNADEVTKDPLNCDGVPKLRELMICATECMAKKFGLLANNGELKRDAVVNYTRQFIGGNKWKSSVLEEYVDKCLGEIHVSKDLDINDDSRKNDCNPRQLEFNHCIWKAFVVGCPVDWQIDSNKCEKIRDRLSKGSKSYEDKYYKRFFDPLN